ncbi:MAG: type II secretion system minor pseudopilin GspI [Gammaproteobacteria bacterium]|nr:type II secretion system minor pseudopilin GspI [Gammaproteobacteria bacterium]
MADRSRRANGFTLIEVLVALVILATVLASTMQLVGVTTRSQAAVIETTLLHWAAKNRLLEVALAQAPEELHNTTVSEVLGAREFLVTAELIDEETGPRRVIVSAEPAVGASLEPYVLEMVVQ